MSILNSVLGSLSPPATFRKSFEDPRALEFELPLYDSSPQPRIPPPVITSTIQSGSRPKFAPMPRIPDEILALQRRARHLEQQLQELLDAQADGLTSGAEGNGSIPEDLMSTGSTTPTVSSVRSADRSTENGYSEHGPRRKKIGLNAARRGISKRIRQLAAVKSDELYLLDENLKNVQITVERTEAWGQKRTRIEKRIMEIESDNAGAKVRSLQSEASSLEQEIREKEEELRALKRRHKQVKDELASTENSQEAKLSSYKTSLSLLDQEVSRFVARPPNFTHVPLSSTPFYSIPAQRRTLDMAREYWQEEYTRLVEKCEAVDVERGALDDGALIWNDVVNKVAEYETSLQTSMQQIGTSNPFSPDAVLKHLDDTISYLEEKLELSTSRNWNLLVCAIGAELETYKQGKLVLEDALGVKRKGKEKATKTLVDFGDSDTEHKEEMTGSAIRITRSSPKPAPPKPSLFDTDMDDDPDPELMISHQDTDTD